MSNEEFALFYDKYKNYLYRICFTYMKRAADAEDCAEDVFVKVLSSDIKFNGDEHEKKWLSVTAANHCKNKLKQRNRTDAYRTELTEDIPADGENNEILQAVLSLPDKYKSVVWFHYYEGYKTNEIAKILKKPPSTVRNLLADARKLLKNML